jgi:hypothetical protein
VKKWQPTSIGEAIPVGGRLFCSVSSKLCVRRHMNLLKDEKRELEDEDKLGDLDKGGRRLQGRCVIRCSLFVTRKEKLK